MAKKCYKITLLSELVLPKNSNTQGKNEQLNFISGAVFLGLVAQRYGEFSDPFALFHSAKVRFGAARVLINGKMSYKTPLCFYAPKAKRDFSELYNALFCDFAAPKLQEKQLKQLASGFINGDLEYFQPPKNYALRVNLHSKSADDEKELFGYESLQKGLQLGFEVDFDESVSRDDLEKALRILEGEHCIGKSKNAEYGEVLFERVEGFEGVLGEDFKENSREFGTLGANGVNFRANSSENSANFKENSQIFSGVSSKNLELLKNYDFIYALSPLALFDKSTAMPSFELNANTLGLESVELALDKTHIKTRSFRAYNAMRRGFDSARLIIEPGSVIALRALSGEDKARLKRGVGGFLSEGYGQVLVNPRFLFCGANEKPFKFNNFANLSATTQENSQISVNFAAKIQPKGENFAAATPNNANSHQNAKNSQNFHAQKDENLISALRALKSEQSAQHSDYSAVASFIRQHKADFKGVSKAQWGTIRAMAYFEPQNFAQKLAAYTAQERLNGVFGECAGLLNDFISQNAEFISENPHLALQNPRAAAQLLAALMPKQDLLAYSGDESSPKGDFSDNKAQKFTPKGDLKGRK